MDNKEIQNLKNYTADFIERALTSNEVKKEWTSGHDYFSHMPYETKKAVPTQLQNCIFNAVALMLLVDNSSLLEYHDRKFKEVLSWLREDKLKTPPHFIPKFLSEGCWSIYYTLELYAKLTKHTCSATERAFLDELREKGIYETEHEIGHDDHIDLEGICPAFISIGDESTVLFQSDFRSNLKELVNE